MFNIDLTDAVTLAGVGVAIWQALAAKKVAREANDIAKEANKLNATQIRNEAIREAAQRQKLYVEADGPKAFRVVNPFDKRISELRVEFADMEHNIVIEEHIKPNESKVFKTRGLTGLRSFPLELKWTLSGNDEVTYEQTVPTEAIWPQTN